MIFRPKGKAPSKHSYFTIDWVNKLPRGKRKSFGFILIKELKYNQQGPLSVLLPAFQDRLREQQNIAKLLRPIIHAQVACRAGTRRPFSVKCTPLISNGSKMSFGRIRSDKEKRAPLRWVLFCNVAGVSNLLCPRLRAVRERCSIPTARDLPLLLALPEPLSAAAQPVPFEGPKHHIITSLPGAGVSNSLVLVVRCRRHVNISLRRQKLHMNKEFGKKVTLSARRNAQYLQPRPLPKMLSPWRGHSDKSVPISVKSVFQRESLIALSFLSTPQRCTSLQKNYYHSILEPTARPDLVVDSCSSFLKGQQNALSQSLFVSEDCATRQSTSMFSRLVLAVFNSENVHIACGCVFSLVSCVGEIQKRFGDQTVHCVSSEWERQLFLQCSSILGLRCSIWTSDMPTNASWSFVTSSTIETEYHLPCIYVTDPLYFTASCNRHSDFQIVACREILAALGSAVMPIALNAPEAAVTNAIDVTFTDLLSLPSDSVVEEATHIIASRFKTSRGHSGCVYNGTWLTMAGVRDCLRSHSNDIEFAAFCCGPMKALAVSMQGLALPGRKYEALAAALANTSQGPVLVVADPLKTLMIALDQLVRSLPKASLLTMSSLFSTSLNAYSNVFFWDITNDGNILHPNDWLSLENTLSPGRIHILPQWQATLPPQISPSSVQC